jgi:hypothetical protein
MFFSSHRSLIVAWLILTLLSSTKNVIFGFCNYIFTYAQDDVKTATCGVDKKMENLRSRIDRAIEFGADETKLFEDIDRVLLEYDGRRDLEGDVREMYEEYPYPPRQHGRHKYGVKALKDCLPSVLNDVYFGGSRDFTQGFRILIAGGGTGDPTLSCVRAFENRFPDIEIVHLDLSSRSNEIAISRVRKFTSGKLRKIAFVRGSILDIPKWMSHSSSSSSSPSSFPTHGNQIESTDSTSIHILKQLFSRKFDYIHTTGVLHHSLHRPGLDSIVSCLSESGGIHVWVYAKEGRRGIDRFQDMMRILLSSSSSSSTTTTWKDKLDLARTLLLSLPPSNSLVRNERLYNIARQWAQNRDHPSDVRISDTFLHLQEAQYDVRQVEAWVRLIYIYISFFLVGGGI